MHKKAEIEDFIKTYDTKKYPAELYKSLKSKFENPQDITFSDIKTALEWKYGKLNHSDYPESHKAIIRKIFDAWREFESSKDFELEPIFRFWRGKLGNNPFITIAFIAHLVKEDIPIIDQHTFRAMLEYRQLPHRAPKSIADYKEYIQFFMDLESKLGLSESDLDKYLMMFGKSIKKTKEQETKDRKRVLTFDKRTLSGNGNGITYQKRLDGYSYDCSVGNFFITDQQVNLVLEFLRRNKRVPIGSSATEPPREGLGYFIKHSPHFDGFNSVQATYIASVLYYEKFIECEGSRPVYIWLID